MRVRHYAQGKFYTIQCPVGSRIVLAPDGEVAFQNHLVVPLNGKEIRIPADPPELLPLLAESGNFGVVLLGPPEPDVRLEGALCPGCGERDVTWLQLDDGSESVCCDRCGADFKLTMGHLSPVPASDPTRG